MPRTRRLVRLLVAATFAFVQMVALLPTASAQTAPRVTATWSPNPVNSATLAGACPTPKDPNAACQINRGTTYTISVDVKLDNPSDSLLINVDGGGLDIQAISRSTGADFTPALAAGQTETIDLTVAVPEAARRNDRTFYIGHVFLTGATKLAGTLTVSVVVPKPRISWGRQLDPKTGDKAPIQTVVGSGGVISRNLSFTSNIDVGDFRINANTNRAGLGTVPTSLTAGQTSQLAMTYNAPIVNRRTTTDVVLSPVVGGVQALERALRIRIVILPAEVNWSPPQLRDTLIVQEQKYTPHTVSIVSNYDIPGVRFKTADLGLTPIVYPLNPIDMKAGVPVQLQLRMCPGYAPTTYFIGITAYQGNKPLNKRLQIRMRVEDNGNGLPSPGAADPCAL